MSKTSEASQPQTVAIMSSNAETDGSVCILRLWTMERQLTPSSQPIGAPDLTSLERFRNILAQPVLASFIAGGVAGAVSRTVVSPLERLKILFQIQSVGREEYKMSVPKALAKMWREEGWRGFMAGNGTNCIRIVPYSAVQFSAYNVYKRVSSLYACSHSHALEHLAQSLVRRNASLIEACHIRESLLRPIIDCHKMRHLASYKLGTGADKMDFH